MHEGNALDAEKEYSIAASHNIANRITAENLRPLNSRELGAVFSLLHFIAFNNNWNKDTLQEALRLKFNVAAISELPQESYEDAIMFLMGLCE